MTRKSPIRPAIAALEPSGITKVTALGLGNPDILPLWFGETDLVTPPFIRQAAAKALEDGRTFYTNARGILPLREAIRDFHKRTIGAGDDHRPGHQPAAVRPANGLGCLHRAATAPAAWTRDLRADVGARHLVDLPEHFTRPGGRRVCPDACPR
jgi:hypothetical protein